MAARACVKLTELFTQAVDLPAGEQATIVERIRATDPELAAELASLLRQDESIVTGLKTAGLKPDDLGGSLRKKTIPYATLGIPGYAMQGELGKGGMGVVYAATQLEICAQALSKQKQHRQASAAELARQSAASRFSAEYGDNALAIVKAWMRGAPRTCSMDGSSHCSRSAHSSGGRSRA